MGLSGRCGFFDLRTGTLILGILSVIVSCCISVYFISVLSAIDARIEGQAELEDALHCKDLECDQWFRSSYVSTLVCALIMSCLHLIAGSILIKAVLKMLPTSLTVYIIQTMFSIGLLAVIAIMNLVILHNRPAAVTRLVFPLVISIAVDTACLVAAHHCRKEMLVQRAEESMVEEEAPVARSKRPSQGYIWGY